MKKKFISFVLALALSLAMIPGCSEQNTETPATAPAEGQIQEEIQNPEQIPTEDSSLSQSETEVPVASPGKTPVAFDLSTVPAFSGDPFYVINDNEPFFSAAERQQTDSFEDYAPLDSLGRCGVTSANIGQDLMPTEERGSIGQVKPTGWQTIKYDCVDGKYLYNRCHLIGYQLTAENANTSNLITGTRYLNIEGMLPFENMTADYIKETGNHVLYRSTPIFEGNNLLATGVLMEGWSVEDNGDGICFNVFCYNAQPGIELEYATGESHQIASGSV